VVAAIRLVVASEGVGCIACTAEVLVAALNQRLVRVEQQVVSYLWNVHAWFPVESHLHLTNAMWW